MLTFANAVEEMDGKAQIANQFDLKMRGFGVNTNLDLE